MRRAVINSTDPLFLERKPLQLEKLVSSVGVLFKPERELYAPSEITKTVVRQLFPPHPFNPFGPTRSWIAAAVLESSLTRRRIMELYLNVATFGSSQGVEEAAKHYYGSSPSGLSKKNAAGLAIASMSQSLDPAEPTDEFTRAQNDLVKTLGTEPVEESAPKKEKSRASKRKGPAE